MSTIHDLLESDKRSKKSQLPAEETAAMEGELKLREESHVIFPLEIFHPALRPLINSMVTEYDIDRGFIGLGFLSALSTAIGTAFCVSTNGKNKIYLSIWGCMVGMTSSGKSLNLNCCYGPHFLRQTALDVEWREKTLMQSEQKVSETHMPTVVFMDAHMSTLIRTVMPDNPKGVAKIQDELEEWINGMDPNSKGGKDGTDMQVWLKIWNSSPLYLLRSGKQKTFIPRPFVNNFGGTQFEILPSFFAKKRDVTGFVFRLLFAVDYREEVILPNPFFTMPAEYEQTYQNLIDLLYDKFSVETHEDEPKMCILSKEAVNVYHNWVMQNIRRINKIEDKRERNIHAGIFGKIKEYALRFSAILFIMDKCLDALEKHSVPDFFMIGLAHENWVPVSYMERAMQACEYFNATAFSSYKLAKQTEQAPAEWLRFSAHFNTGASFAQVGSRMWGTPSSPADAKRKSKRAERMYKKYAPLYPWTIKAKKQ